MKKLWRLLSVFILSIGIVSCSNANDDASLSIAFNGADLAAHSPARNISLDATAGGYYIIVSVLGDYTETKSLHITSNGTYTIEFNSIPAGARVYVEANVYDQDPTTFCHTFTGSSETQTVGSGENRINLSLNNLQSAVSINSLSGAFNNNLAGYVFRVYNNGKYQVKDSSGVILSEGIYNVEGVLEAGTVVRIKECAYRTYSSTEVNGVSDPSELMIVERPVWTTMTVGADITGAGCLDLGSTKVF
ncbi:MAG: hypothetical protein K6E22_04275 [Treponema sp.]|nr:hypothetical protein [Treponema sp.]